MVKRAILCAGHGGGDSGAVGQGTTEAAECIQIVNRLADKLRADGQVEVVVVPHELNLIPSIDWVKARYKNTNDGICIEVHKNATVNAHGIEVWYYGGDQGSANYAQTILNGIMSVPGMPVSRGIKPDTQNAHGRLGWVRDTPPVALLVEMGFVSNGGDPVDDVADDRYAEGLKVGLLAAFGLKSRGIPVPAPAPDTRPGEKTLPKYRVYNSAGKQVGAYNTEASAWNKYSNPTSQAVKIVESATGTDVTGQFVAKYRPQPSQPAPGSEPHPVDKEQNARLSALESLVSKIADFLASIFSGFKK